MSGNNHLKKSLKELERIRRKSLRKLSENCKSEYLRNSTIYGIMINYKVAKRWMSEIYLKGKYAKKINLSELEKYAREDTAHIGYYSSHLDYHIKQIRMLGERHSD